MIYEDIKNFGRQFEWYPDVVNAGKLGRFRKFIVVGMGGSNLAADLVKILRPDLEIIVHRDYGLPEYLESDRLVILSSYSGNTEEVLDAYRAAGKRNLPRFAVGAGGNLLELAEKDGIPYIKFPESKIQPRVALGWSFLALLKAVGDEELLAKTSALAAKFDSADLEEKGKELAGKLKGFTPVIYASHRNKGLSYIWKIVFNETAKTPAFANVWPELNHNEMTGFSAGSGNFCFILLHDKDDHPRVIKRAAVTEKILAERGYELEKIGFNGSSALLKIFNSVILAHFTAYHLAINSGAEPEAVPMVEDFKKLIE